MAKDAPSSVEREYAFSLGLWGWVTTLWRAICITFGLLYKVVRATFGGPKKGFAFYDYIAYEGMRDYQTGLNAVGVQNLLPSTRWTYVNYAKSHGIPHTEIHLRDGTTVIQLGGGSKQRVLVHFHGGGYMAPALSEHARFACGFAESVPDNTSIYVLQYALASENANHYPRQLQQAVTLMEYLLQSEKISPSAITLIGDSAGAHLALGLLLHLTHPNPKVSTLEMEGRLSGAALISPWVMNATSVHESMTANKDKDLLSAEALDYWTKNFMGDAAPDYWNSLLTVPGKWWTEMPVEDILATYGDDELLRDAASELCNAIQKGHAKAITRRFSTELHAHMLMNRFLHINKPCESEQVFRDWLDGRLKAE